MGAYIGSLLDHGLFVLIFGYLAYDYGKSVEKRTARPWLLPIAAILVLYHGVYLIIDIVEGPPPKAAVAAVRTPTQEELKEQFKQAKGVTSDTPIRLQRGPRLIIPADYRYIEPPDGAIILYSIGPRGEVLVVSFYGEELTDLAKGERELKRTAKENKRPWVLGEGRKAILHGCDALIMDFANPATKMKGYQIFATNGKYGYGLMITLPESYLRIAEPELQKIIQSFAVGL